MATTIISITAPNGKGLTLIVSEEVAIKVLDLIIPDGFSDESKTKQEKNKFIAENLE